MKDTFGGQLEKFNSVDKPFSLLCCEIEIVRLASGLFHYSWGKHIKYDRDQLESWMVFHGMVSNFEGEKDRERKYTCFS